MIPRITAVFILTSIFNAVAGLGEMWCQAGGAKKEMSPMQCDDGTLECFKYVCDGIDSGQLFKSAFTARGCGVSIKTTATGLVNQSCFQAMEVCQKLGGQGECAICQDKHMCNGAAGPSGLLYLVSAVVIVSYVVLYAR